MDDLVVGGGNLGQKVTEAQRGRQSAGRVEMALSQPQAKDSESHEQLKAQELSLRPGWEWVLPKPRLLISGVWNCRTKFLLFEASLFVALG